MNFHTFIFVLASIIFPSYGKLSRKDVSHMFDMELHNSVLDPELCQKQLEYIRNNDTLLQLKFLDSGLRIPRGILNGNTQDYGNYPQCVSINKAIEDMKIQGKHCMIKVPLNLNLQTHNTEHYAFNPLHLHLNQDTKNLLSEYNKEKSLLLTREGMAQIRNDEDQNVQSMSFRLALCVPHHCTTREALNGLLFNLSIVNFEYEDVSCRLPNDKPWVAADYIAWVVVALLSLCTILSTGYDVYFTIILKKDTKETSALLTSFSMYKNSCSLMKISSRPGSLECLDGIRTLSIFWVIVGHTFFMAIYFPQNPLEMFTWYISIRAIWMKTAPLAVDTFFLLSGLLVVYTTARKFTTKQLVKNLHLFYLHRLLRMFPVLAAVILFKSSFYHHLGDGPMWTFVASDSQSCRSYWWVTLLYIQNFLTQTQQGGCVPETWYLAIDIQLHILSPLVLFWVLSGAKRTAWVSLISGFLISMTGAAIYIFINNFVPLGTNTFTDYYINIIARAPPFFVGMIYGYLLHLWREDRFSINKMIGYFVTTFSLGMIALIIYCDHIKEQGDVESQTIMNIFMTFLRTSWVITIGWIIFACVGGYAGPINWFLSLSIWKIPARISYAMYLIHMSIMFAYYGSTLQTIHFSVGAYMFDFFAFLYITIFVSFFLTVLIDAPFATLFRLLFEVGKKTSNGDEQKNKRIDEIHIPREIMIKT